jgi:hypothetical protein
MAQIHRLSGISRIILACFSFTRSSALLTLPVVRFGVSVLEKQNSCGQNVTIRLTAASIISRCQERMLK